MNSETVLEKLKQIFKDTFDDEMLEVSIESSPKTVEGWDSLMQISLIFSIEGEFGIQFSLDELTKINTIKDIVDFIVKKEGVA